MRVLLAIFIALVCGIVNAAAPECVSYQITHPYPGSPAVGSTREQACSSYAGAYAASATSSAWSVSASGVVTGTQCGGSANWCPTAGGGCEPATLASRSISEVPVECPEDECEASAGNTGMLSGSGSAAPSTACDGGCGQVLKGLSVAMGGMWAGRYESTGTSCDVPDDLTQNVNCITTASGRVCASKEEKNCGLFNGRTMCVDDVPDGICTVSEGGALCAPGASGGPTDSEGAPATPDAVVKTGDGSGGAGSNYNYFSNTTIGGSSTTVTGSGGGASGTSGGDGDGEGEGGGGEPCSGEAECYGQLPESFGECADDLSACVSSAATAAWSSLQASVPLIAFGVDLHANLGTSGTCPMAPITVFDNEYDVMGPVCSILLDNSDLLALILQICWSFMGLRILYGAE